MRFYLKSKRVSLEVLSRGAVLRYFDRVKSGLWETPGHRDALQGQGEAWRQDGRWHWRGTTSDCPVRFGLSAERLRLLCPPIRTQSGRRGRATPRSTRPASRATGRCSSLSSPALGGTSSPSTSGDSLRVTVPSHGTGYNTPLHTGSVMHSGPETQPAHAQATRTTPGTKSGSWYQVGIRQGPARKLETQQLL